MREGYIKLYRSLLENPLYNIKPYSKGQAWITILLLTNHSASFINVKNGTLVKVEKGQCGYSEKALADLFGWSRGKLRRFLEQLKKEKMIQQKIVENHSIITVLNYKHYQIEQQKRSKTVQQTVQQTDTNNNEKNIYSNTSYIKVSLSIEEREILKNYLLETSKRKIDDIDAYIRRLIDNGDYVAKLEKAKRRLKRQEEKKKQVEIIEGVKPEEVDSEALKVWRQKIKRRK